MDVNTMHNYQNQNRSQDRSHDRSRNIQKKPREEYAMVLDFLKNGYPFDSRPSYKKVPIIQAIGLTNFTLLELAPKKDVHIEPNQKVYIGTGKRDQVNHIIGVLPFDKLTSSAEAELEFIIENVVKEDESRFITFFNKAQPLSIRMHQLELLPGLGKKHMIEILDARDDKEFETFNEIKERVKLMPNPLKLIVKRILAEIQEEQKHYLFVRL